MTSDIYSSATDTGLFKYFYSDHTQTDDHHIKVSEGFSAPQDPITLYISHYRNSFAGPQSFNKRQINYAIMKVTNEKYRKERERLNTFKDFPKHLRRLVAPLAKSGFYYVGSHNEPDKVKCIYCQGVLGKWKPSDNPARAHKKSYPTCPFILNLNVGNETVKGESPTCRNIDPDLTNNCGIIPYNVIHNSFDVPLLLPEHLTKDIDWRERTFQNLESLKHLALEGLYVETEKNETLLRCCSCLKEVHTLSGIENLQWQHLHYSNCKYRKHFPIIVKTSFFLDNNQSTDAINMSRKRCSVEYIISDEEVEARTDLFFSTKIERCDKDLSFMKSVFLKRLMRTGKEFESIFEIFVDAKNYKDEKSEDSGPNILDFILQDCVCVVCFENTVEVVFLPCGHLRTCRTCSIRFTNCPICRKGIEKRIRNIQFQRIF